MRFENDKSTCRPLEKVMGTGKYYWCRCGKSAMPPFCDGAHLGTGVEPLGFRIDKTHAVSICNCGLTVRPPYCDGHHGED